MCNPDEVLAGGKGSIQINVLIKDKKYKVFCGEGKQKVRWLTDAAICKYENYNEKKCGVAYSLKLENGNLCELDDMIRNVIQNNENVWILFKDEFDANQEDQINKINGELTTTHFAKNNNNVKK